MSAKESASMTRRQLMTMPENAFLFPDFNLIFHFASRSIDKPTGALSRCHSSTLSLRTTSSSGKKRSRRRVSINNDVEIKPIPERSEYSPDVRQKMWTSGSEIYSNAARNTIEFASENWNWRNVTEDENMLRHTITRELIHPIHLHNAMELARQQEDAANSNGNNNGQRQQTQCQNPVDFMAQLPLERNDGSSASTTPVAAATSCSSSPTLSVAAAAATHAAVATARHAHNSTGPPSPPAVTA